MTSQDSDSDINNDNNNNSNKGHRRSFLEQQALLVTALASSTITTAAFTTTVLPLPAHASGGATAGRYTTIPIAKRRYYGRVQQGVHEFLLMGPALMDNNNNIQVEAQVVQDFFDVTKALIVPARRQDISGQCTKKDRTCQGKAVYDSRYNDMKASMYLLGNAFRTDQQKPPDRLPTVKAAKAFFQTMDEMEKIVQQRGRKVKVVTTTTNNNSNNNVNDSEAVATTTAATSTTTTTAIQYSPKDAAAVAAAYANALELLDVYLDLVELPPTNSGHYDQEFDTQVGDARIT